MSITLKTHSNPYYRVVRQLDGASYLFRIHWTILTSKWYLDIKGLSNSVDIKGIALLPGKDLLTPFGYGGQLGELWVIDNSSGTENPNYEDMGTRWTLEYTPK